MNGMTARRMVSCKMAAPRMVLCKMAVYKP